MSPRVHACWTALAAALLSAAAWAAAPAAAPRSAPPAGAAYPDYTITPCCSLCPQAANEAVYGTAFLKSFSTLIEGEDGWLFRTTEDLRTEFGADDEALRSLRLFNEALKRRGITLVIMMQPPRGLMHADKLRAGDRQRYDAARARSGYEQALRALRAQGIVVPPLEQLLDVREGGDYFFRGDHHWTPAGAHRTAEMVAASVRSLPQYGALPKQRFVTQRTGIFGKRGTMQKAALLICGQGSADQYVDVYGTESQNDDLLGEAKAPAVVLVGTSNSDTTYNFSGFLSEYLETDVLNVSVAGGGLDGAMLNYLPSAEFRNTPPRVLIWELEAYHNLSSKDFWRQLLPQLDNSCNEGEPKLVRHTKLKKGRNEVLFDGGRSDLRSSEHLVDIRFDDPSIKDLTAVIWYANGRKETLTLELSEHVLDKGRFVFNLRDEPGWAELSFLSVDVLQAETPAKPVTVEARICARQRGKTQHTAGVTR